MNTKSLSFSSSFSKSKVVVAKKKKKGASPPPPQPLTPNPSPSLWRENRRLADMVELIRACLLWRYFSVLASGAGGSAEEEEEEVGLASSLGAGPELAWL